MDFNNKKYLTSIILLNRGRNKLDNLFYNNYRDKNDRSIIVIIKKIMNTNLVK